MACPLPMKMRALPESFWQQPNSLATVSPTVYSPPVGEEIEKVSESKVIGAVNTDLLFSLFNTVESDIAKNNKTKEIPTPKRGRPRKRAKEHLLKIKKDLDPYFNSATVPSIKIRQDNTNEAQKVLAMISVKGEVSNLNSCDSYIEKLNDLAVNL